MAPAVPSGAGEWISYQRQISPYDWSSQRQISSAVSSKGTYKEAVSPEVRERQALVAAIERDYAKELQRISNDWILTRALPKANEKKHLESDIAPPLPRYVDVAEVLGLPNFMLSAMLAAKCRDQNILPTKERQQRFAEYVFANCAENVFQMTEAHLGAEFAKALALTLAVCTRYTELNLSGNALCDQGAQTMATLLLKTTTLTSVDLSANDISSKGMNFILRAMLINRSVQSLDLSSKTGSSRNRFTKINAGPLEDLTMRNSTLQRLSLSMCTLGAVGVQGLSRGLVGNQSLRFLDLSQNDIGDRGACFIASVLKECVLEELNLADNNIGDEGFISIACSLGSLPNKIDGSSHVWSRAMEPTKAATAYADSVGLLRKTVLETDEQDLWPKEDQKKGAAEEIKDVAKALQMAVKAAEVVLPKLKVVILSNNLATSIGTRCVADALQANNYVEKLSMDHCDHRDPDNGFYALIVSLPVNNTLKHLGLSYALLGPNGLINLAKVIAANEVLRSLNLSGNLVDEKSATAWSIALGGNKYLKSLGLAACHINDDAGVILAQGLAKNQGLESVSLRDNALRDSAPAFEEALMSNGTLIQLNLELNSIDLRYLSKIKQLLERNSKIREKGLPERCRLRIAELTECQQEVGKMSQILMRNRQKKRVALWKQAAKVQKLKDEKDADRKRQAQVEDQLNELLKTQEQVEEEISMLEDKLNSLRADGAQKISVLGARTDEIQDKMRVGEIQLNKMRKQLESFEAQAGTELAAVNQDLERAMKAQQSAALLSTAAQRNLSTFAESLNAISEDIAGGVAPRQRWSEFHR